MCVLPTQKRVLVVVFSVWKINTETKIFQLIDLLERKGLGDWHNAETSCNLDLDGLNMFMMQIFICVALTKFHCIKLHLNSPGRTNYQKNIIDRMKYGITFLKSVRWHRSGTTTNEALEVVIVTVTRSMSKK